MIKINKLNEPQVLIDNGKEWTRQHLENIANGVESSAYLKSRYNHKDIKDQIVKETNGKCAYCESKLRHIHHGDIEHIFPKSLDETKRFEWNNLTLACEICNQYKSNQDPYLTHIQDPYASDPEKSFLFAGSLIVGLNTTGICTESILKLNRAELLERRLERLEKIRMIFQNAINLSLPQPVRQNIYNDLIRKEADSSSEYAAMVKCFIMQIKSNLPTDILT